jgi:oxygen-dependent protoporphyrinogen oxidase
MSTERNIDVAVIGAGLTGLTAAFYLKRRNADFIVLEEKDRTGGVIRTRHEEGFVFEEGPNTGILSHPEVAELFEDLGNSCKCEMAGENVNKRYILFNGAWQALPMGLFDAVRTPLFTWSDKFRILGEPFRKKGTNPEESLGEMVKRRLGQSFLDYAVDPFILGVYSGDPAKLITKYAFPKLYNLEQDYGSFVGGAVRKKFAKRNERDRKASRKVFSVKGGLSNLIRALEKAAGEDRFVFNAKNIVVHPAGGGYRLQCTGNGETIALRARSVITTVGAYALPSLLPFIPESKWAPVAKMKYARVIQAVVGYRHWNGLNPDGFGGLVPFRESRDILGVLFLSSLFEGRAPGGGALFAVFAGGVRREDLFEKTDNEIREIIAGEFTDMMRTNGFNPDIYRIIRYPHAIPQYGPESRAKLSMLDEIQKTHKGLIIGGNLRDGIGMADRIRQGKQLAGWTTL